MKTFTFTLAFIILSFLVWGQFREAKVTDHLMNKAEIYPVKNPEINEWIKSEKSIIGNVFTDEIVGNTIYDLQTLNSIQQRIYTYPDGTIGLTWMMGFEEGSWSDRGTGYNYFNSFEWNDYPLYIVEQESTGWPCYAPLGEGGEIVVSFYYSSNEWYLVFNKREVKGEGDWESFYLFGPDGYGISNPAMITNGPNHTCIHLLANTRGQEYLNQGRALLYYCSMDSGETWDIEHYFFEELGSEFFSWIPDDSYSWASPKGDTLAFSVGFLSEHGFIMKSFDNGESWDQILVYENPYAPYQGGTTPVFGAGDITQSVALDSQGKAHMVFGRMKYYYNAQGTQYYFPATEGLIYWNEDMEPLDTTMVSSFTLEHLIENGNLVGWVIPNMGDSTLLGWGQYYVSLTSFPQINIDEQDRVFILYSGAAAGFEVGSKNFRHIYGNSSNDGGLTWNGITDCNTDLIYVYTENVFPAMSPTFYGNKIHFFFQSDNAPGMHVWTNEHDPENNSIVYMNLDTYLFTGSENYIHTKSETGTLVNYPNPFDKTTYFNIDLLTDSHILLEIFDLQGKPVRTEVMGWMSKGSHRIKLDRGALNNGIYFFSIQTNEKVSSGKMIVH
ncbi:MAG: T9SS type A sorting domain-containing protein [Bacteroidales bacterium]|nr:T9SS type A sorting domain-containing protein [Bacteroidales bacterium]